MNKFLNSILILFFVIVAAAALTTTVSAQCTGTSGTGCSVIPTQVQPFIPPCANCATPAPTSAPTPAPTNPPATGGGSGTTPNNPNDGLSDGKSSTPAPAVQSVLGLSKTSAGGNMPLQYAQLLGALALSMASYRFFNKKA